MEHELALALKYGGFTRMDEVYLKQTLLPLSPKERLVFLTPPPSVINAYFAELYQKQGPKAATDYYLALSKAFGLMQDDPSFREEKPFVRLNLSGKSYGFAYISQDEVAQVFAEKKEPVSEMLLLELAQIFPQYVVTSADDKITMQPAFFDETVLEELSLEGALLSQVSRLKGGLIKLTSFNQEELLLLASRFNGKRYYQFSQRQSMIYIKE